MQETFVAARVKQYVKSYLRKTGKKQSFLAYEIGIEPKVFSQLINGRRVMKIDDLATICRFFNEPASTFIVLENPVAS